MRNPRVTAILARITDGQRRAGPLPTRLCAECLSALPISGAGIALTATEWASGIVLAATDNRSRQLSELQLLGAEHPCGEASSTGRPVLHPDLGMSGPTRWPKFCKVVLPLNVRAIFAFPLAVSAGLLGFLNLYRATPGRLSGAELGEALAFADAATVVLLHLRDRSHLDNGPLDGGPRTPVGPVDGRTQVHQAIGVIAGQLGITAEDALQRLRAHAYVTRRTLIEVAADVIGRRIRFNGHAGVLDDGRPASAAPRDIVRRGAAEPANYRGRTDSSD